MVTVEVCVGSACHLKGAYNIINRIQELVKEKNLKDKVEVKAAFCLGNCTHAVSTRINQGEVMSVSEENVDDFFEKNVIGRL